MLPNLTNLSLKELVPSHFCSVYF